MLIATNISRKEAKKKKSAKYFTTFAPFVNFASLRDIGESTVDSPNKCLTMVYADSS
jgi:hypothetical protein